MGENPEKDPKKPAGTNSLTQAVIGFGKHCVSVSSNIDNDNKRIQQ